MDRELTKRAQGAYSDQVIRRHNRRERVSGALTEQPFTYACLDRFIAEGRSIVAEAHHDLGLIPGFTFNASVYTAEP